MATNPWEENYSSDSNAGNEPWNENYESVEPPKRGVVDVIKDVGVTALKGAVALPQAIVGLADIPTGGHVGKALEDIGYRPHETQKILEKLYSPAQQEANRKVHEADGFVETLQTAVENPSAIATTIGESIPQMIGGAGVARGIIKAGQAAGKTVAPWAAGAIGEGVIGAGSAEESIRGQTPDGLTTAKQSLAAGATGVGTGLLGALGGKFSQKVGLADIDTMLAQGGANAATAMAAKAGFVKQVIGSGISEGVFEELPQSVQEQMWQNYALGKPLTDGVGNAAALGLLSGSAMGGAGGGYNAMVGKIAPGPQKSPATPLGNAAIEAVNQGITPVPNGAISAQELLGTPDATDNEQTKPVPSPLSQAEHNLRANTVKKMETPALEAIIASAQASPPKTPSAELIYSLALAERERRAAADTAQAKNQLAPVSHRDNQEEDPDNILSANPPRNEDYTPQPEAVERPTIDIAPDVQPLGHNSELPEVAQAQPEIEQSQPTDLSASAAQADQETQPTEGATNGTTSRPDSPTLDSGSATSAGTNAEGSNANGVLRYDTAATAGRNGLPGTVVANDGASGVSANAGDQPSSVDQQKKVTDGDPPLEAGMTRLYHGSATHGRYDGPAWFSTNREYARLYRGEKAELQYVDMPTAKVNSLVDPDDYGQTVEKGFTLNQEFDTPEVGIRRPIFPSKSTTQQSPSTPLPASAPQEDVLTAAQKISETLRQSIEQLIGLRKNAGQLHLAQKLDQAVNKAKQAMKTGSGSASDFNMLAKAFKGKDDAIHVTLMSIANTLEPVKNTKPKRKIGVPKTMSMLQFVASIGGFNRASIAKEIGRLDDMKA
ncbi:MAG: hypothetical protein Q7T25_06150, partial [Sideroxyarcus sp.]|nr:hypothetical protein [Sideroxyarcus sp.]